MLRGRGIKCENLDLPGGPVVKNPSASAEDAGLIPWSGKIPWLIQLSPVICRECIYTRTLIKTVLLPTMHRAHCKNLLFSVFYSRPEFWEILPSTTSPVLPLRLIFTDSLELAKNQAQDSMRALNTFSFISLNAFL